MAWIKTLPDGSLDAARLDDDVRTNNAAIEDALGVEHYFSTGGSQTGRHKFGLGNTAARNAITPQHGMIWFNTDVYASHVCVQIYQTNAWVNVDVFQTNLFRTDAQTRATVPQYADWVEIAYSGASLPVNFALSPRKWATLTQNTTLSNPINDSLAGTAGTDIIIDLIQNGTGGWTVTFGSNYVTADGLAPLIAATAAARTRLYISSTVNSKYLVSTAPNMKAIT